MIFASAPVRPGSTGAEKILDHRKALEDWGIARSGFGARRLLELEPKFHIQPIINFLAFMRPEPLGAISAGLRQAGLPE